MESMADKAPLTALSSASWLASARRVHILKIARIKMVEWEFLEENSLITYSWESILGIGLTT